MAFDATGWQNLTAFGKNAPNLISYESSVDSLATVSASGYFNDFINELEVGYVIFSEASDDNQLLRVTSVTTNVTVENYQVANVEDGSITTVKLANLAVTAAKIGPLAVETAKIDDLAVTAAKLGALAVETAKLDALAVTTAKITDGNVTQVKIAANALDGTVTANLGDASTVGGLPVVITVETAGGVTADVDVVMANKVRILDVFVINKAAGTATDTIVVKNGATAITNEIDISGADKTVARQGTNDVAQATISASGTLRVTETDGAGSDSPATTVVITAVRVA